MRVDGITIGEMEAPKVQYTENTRHIEDAPKHQVQPEDEISDEKIEAAIKKINANADVKSNGIKFEKDEDTSKWVVKVFNEKTGEVIRQIPAKEFLTIAKSIEMAMGSIFNKEA